jgi:hypothetical protein
MKRERGRRKRAAVKVEDLVVIKRKRKSSE